MDTHAFVDELTASNRLQLASLSDIGAISGEQAAAGDLVKLLQIALANEISVSELAACWMPQTSELDVKLALAKQAGDEARHFSLVASRLEALGVSTESFVIPGVNSLFEYMRSLPTSVEKVAAGQFTLESIAYNVNQNFMRLCEAKGDEETVRIYREFIQPDEIHHHELGRMLLQKYATTPELQQRAKEAATRTLQIAAELRRKAAEKIGTQCFPGC